MSLLFATGFDKTLAPLEEYTSLTGGTPVVIGATGRNGGNAARHTSSGSNAGRGTLSIPTTSTLIMGMAFRPATVASSGHDIFSVNDVAGGNVQQAKITIDTTGTCHLTGTSSTFSLTIGAYQYLEVKLTIHNSAGAWVVRVDGTEVLNETGLDTQSSANASCDSINMSGGSSVSTVFDFDDWVVMDTSGSNFNDFLGDVRVIEQLPTGDGATMQFTPSSGTDGYAMVDDTDPDDDSTYIQDSTAGHIARFTFPSLPSGIGSIYANDVLWFGKTTTAGTHVMRGNVLSSATAATGSNVTLTTSYKYGRGHFVTDPDTSAAWTASGVNASEIGVEVVS